MESQSPLVPTLVLAAITASRCSFRILMLSKLLACLLLTLSAMALSLGSAVRSPGKMFNRESLRVHI